MTFPKSFQVGGSLPIPLVISNKTAAYTVVAGDAGAVINCTSGTFTVSLPAAATLGAGFNVTIWNTGTGAITLTPNAAETIDGLATRILRRSEGSQIICNGSNWNLGNKKTMLSYAENSVNNSPIASGVLSVAIGSDSQATQQDAYAIGRTASAEGQSAIAIGTSVTASGTRSTAIGQNSSAQGAQAITGTGAMALGGSYASGTDSFAAAITNNTSTYGATGTSSVAIGAGLARATGARALALMNNSVASGADSVAIGRSVTASAERSFALGFGATSGIFGKYSYSGAAVGGVGGSQTGLLLLMRDTTDATATVLTSDAGAPAASNQVILPNNSAYAFDGIIVARRQAAGGTESAAWRVEGLIRRDGTAASTTLVASTVTAISNAPAWVLALTADTTNGGLAVTFTGAAATNIRTVATIRTSEVTYA